MFIYIFSFLILFLPIFYNKKKLFKVFSIVFIFFGIFSFCMTFFKTLMIENLHNLNYYSYIDSFNKAMSILKNEYVLNDYKQIDYDKLYDKYYPLIKEAQDNNDEQLYYKTMFEFAKSFNDGHLYFRKINLTSSEDVESYSFINDYFNRDYGFSSVLLSSGEVAAIGVEPDSEAYNKGLRDGMIITKKNGISIDSVLDTVVTPKKVHPVLEDERFLNSFYLFSFGDDLVSVSFLDGDEKTITLHDSKSNLNRADDLYYKIMYKPDFENLYTKMLDDDTGYIYVSDEYYNPFLGAVGYVVDDSPYLTKVVDKKIQNLIDQGMTHLFIDLRTKPGGYITESEAIASLFTNDSYLVAKVFKGDISLSDKTYLTGIGKYSDMKITVLVNSATVSSGDILTYLFSKNPNAKIVGFTNSNNSAQSVGGVMVLSGGNAYISYPIYNAYDIDNNVLIDTDSARVANVKLDYRINLTSDNIGDIFYSDDYLLNYVLNNEFDSY